MRIGQELFFNCKTRSTLAMNGANELVYELSIVGEEVTCVQTFTRVQ